MKRRYVVIALAVIPALVIASPGFGVSIKKLVKKEVSKQISQAIGPAGANGTNGTNGADGADGADGTARAYAYVIGHGLSPCAPNCDMGLSSGISNVTHEGITGAYCVHAPGIDATSVSAAVSVVALSTAGPPGNSSAMSNTNCGGDPTGFQVRTASQPSTEVRNAAGDGTVEVAGNAVAADTVSFMIVIP